MVDPNKICQECINPSNNIKNNRILIRQDDNKEGIIELRRGLSDMNLGEKLWGRVRIFIGESNKRITGMGIYSDDIPDEYDAVFYTRLRSDGKLTGYGEEKRTSKTKPFEVLEEVDAGNWESFSKRLMEHNFLK